MNKRIFLNIILTAASLLCFSNNLEALLPREDDLIGNLWDYPGRRKQREMAEMVKSTFENVIPHEELDLWSEKLGKLGIAVDDSGCSREWVRKDEFGCEEKILILFENNPHKTEKRQFHNIEEAIECWKKNLGKGFEWKVDKLNDFGAIVEMNVLESGLRYEMKTISLVILSGNWEISIDYEYPLYKLTENKRQEAWEKKRDIWTKRFQNVQFG